MFRTMHRVRGRVQVTNAVGVKTSIILALVLLQLELEPRARGCVWVGVGLVSDVLPRIPTVCRREGSC